MRLRNGAIAALALLCCPLVQAQMKLPDSVTKETLVNGKPNMQIIYTGPHTRSAEIYYTPLTRGAEPAKEQPVPPSIRAPIPFQIRQLFPVHTPTMSPGRYDPERMPSLTRQQIPTIPLCIVGTDPVSVRWLKINYAVLREKNARCICVEAARLEDWQALKATVPDLPITPAAAPDFARIGIPYYPVLIEQSGIQQ